MIQEIAKLDYLRRAHNTEGRINKAKTPDGVERYLTQEFDQLVPFPTSTSIHICLSNTTGMHTDVHVIY